VESSATSPNFRLVVDGNVGTPLSLSIDELRALPQRDVTLPITCVDGWSATGTWGGVPVADLLRRSAAGPFSNIQIVSLQRPGTAYASSDLDVAHATDPDTLLALDLNGEPLHLDHGFPIRLIAPNRPGVMQTKWVTRIVVE
jgi:DMSO/TMAO reductase YedYZ molybdopterin-dependent catalytic subunit